MANKNIDVRQENRAEVMPELDQVFDDMVERFFGDRFRPLLGNWPLTNRKAVSHIQETDNAYLLSAEIPGIPKEDIQIDVNGNLLTVRAEHKEQSGSEGSKEGFQRQYRSFHQSFALPTTIDANKIEAHCENGVLEIMLPKTEQAQPKKIEIQSGKGGFFKRLLGNKDEENVTSPNGGAKH